MFMLAVLCLHFHIMHCHICISSNTLCTIMSASAVLHYTLLCPHQQYHIMHYSVCISSITLYNLMSTAAVPHNMHSTVCRSSTTLYAFMCDISSTTLYIVMSASAVPHYTLLYLHRQYIMHNYAGIKSTL